MCDNRAAVILGKGNRKAFAIAVVAWLAAAGPAGALHFQFEFSFNTGPFGPDGGASGEGTPRGLAEAAQRLREAIWGLLAALLEPTRPDNARIERFDPPRHTRSHRANTCRLRSEIAV